MTQEMYDDYTEVKVMGSYATLALAENAIHALMPNGIRYQGNTPDYQGNAPDNQGNAPDNQGNVPDNQGNAPDTSIVWTTNPPSDTCYEIAITTLTVE